MATWTRRRIIVATGTVGATGLISGCAEEQSQANTPLPDVVVFNDTSTETTATVAVSGEESDEPLVSESVSITAREAAEYPDVLPSSGTFTLAVDVQDGPAADATRSISAESASLQAIIRSESIQFRVRKPTSD